MRTFSISRHLARLAAVTVFSLACAGPVLADAPEDTEFAALATRYVDEFGKYSPVGATKLGDHRRDGAIDDVGAAGRTRGLRGRGAADRARIDGAKLAARTRSTPRSCATNCAAVWNRETFRDWAWDPQVYSGSRAARSTT